MRRAWNKGKPWSEEVKKKISIACKGQITGSKNPNWKGGRFKRLGYVFILKPEHPNCEGRGYVREHILVMEEHLGRYLKPEEQVHHLNRRRDDNRIKNLKLCANNSEHQKLHPELANNLGKYLKRKAGGEE